ncbi:hypothetical protein BC628DRAFT_1513678 [Trametes gibbosa]|nr:hypothetical protein BC628DRAFT_1513678 [Trametes gibbosa]
MSSLNNLLNPESSYESSLRLQAVRSPTSSTTSPTEKPIETIHTLEIKPPPAPPPPRAEVFVRAHEPHPDCPDTLACLPDTDGRPQHTLPVILRCTILGSPRKRLTIREIYAAMERKYPYYKTAGPAWKQSVRHHLSLNRLFERQPRPPSDPGFGSYWTVNLDAPPGTKRPRKRGGRSTKTDGSETGTLTVLGPSTPPPAPIPIGQRTLPALPGPPAPLMPPSSNAQIPPPPPSATPSNASSVASVPSSGPSTSSTATSASVSLTHVSHLSSQRLPEDLPQAHPSPPTHHIYPQSSQSILHLQQYPYSHMPPQPPHHAHAQPPSHLHSLPPPPTHSGPPPHVHHLQLQLPHPKPPSQGHSQLSPHAHPHSHMHSQPMHPPHGQSLPPPSHISGHPHSQQSPPYAHAQSHIPPQPPSAHPNSTHSHSHPPPSHGHSHSHNQHSPVTTNGNSQSVSTIAKLRPVDSRSFSHGSSLRPRRMYDDDDDDEMDWEEDGAAGPYTEDDYSSSEDMPYQYDPRHHNHASASYAGPSHRSYSTSQAQPGRSVLHGAFSGYTGIDHQESTIERLKMEMAGLRRQSQDAVNASLRLSDELQASREELTRSKAAVKVAETMREEEVRRRIQAEKTAEEEVRRRRAAEDALRQYQAQAQRKTAGFSARS